ncbi:MAG: exodeoxyribonuclease VII small subunit [Planctomycetaceae bacterium]|nr:exodeoxyribonuclease VII small subunit [Planctomycetaceae bacterium]
MSTQSDAPQNETARLSFEQALAQLEGIVEKIESGQVPLEQAIEMYAQGTRLVQQCRVILDAAEKKIQLLSKNADGSLTATGELEDETQV